MNNENGQQPGMPGGNQMNYQQGMPGGNQMNYQQGMPNGNQPYGAPGNGEAEKNSGMGVAAFVLSLIGCTSTIGLILGIVDVAVHKKNKHGLAIAAIIIAILWSVIGIVFYQAKPLTHKNVADKKVEKSDSQDSDSKKDANSDKKDTKDDNKSETKVYHIGDVVEVTTDDGSYRFSITGVTETADRNEYSDTPADRVIIIDYNYENIDYEVEFGDYQNNELNISELNFDMYDDDGNVMEMYPAVGISYAQAVSPGHKASGQMAYALNSSKNYIEAEYHDNIFESSDFTFELTW